MVTKPITSTTANTAPKVASSSNKLQLKTEDFIKMMVTQLQQQDPMEPAKNEQLLAQMSQIGQLQSSTQLQDSIKSLVQQNQIGAASALIGKTVNGLDANDDPISGLVNSVKVGSDGVKLELDNGKNLDLSRVSSIAPAAGTATAGTQAKAA